MKKLLLFSAIVIMFSQTIAQTQTGCTAGNCQDGQGTFVYPNTGTYTGEFKNGNRNGQGTFTYASGDKYTGEWIDGKQSGQGTYMFYSGGIYKGIYRGQWQNGKQNGQGTFTNANGTMQAGEWKDGIYIGASTTQSSTTTLAQSTNNYGSFKNNNTTTLQTGCIYGNCQDGQGTFTWANGEKYVGEWKNGKENGQGTFTFANGNKYVGEWKDYWENGQGTYTWPSGQKYVGEWKNGKYNGTGTLTFANGQIQQGEWKDGQYIGTSNNQTIVNTSAQPTNNNNDTATSQTGCVTGNCQDGQGTFIYSDGGKYIGEFKNGLRNGQGTFTYPNGEKYVGEYKDGERSGQGTYTYASGTMQTGEFLDGQYIGASNSQGSTNIAAQPISDVNTATSQTSVASNNQNGSNATTPVTNNNNTITSQTSGDNSNQSTSGTSEISIMNTLKWLIGIIVGIIGYLYFNKDYKEANKVKEPNELQRKQISGSRMGRILFGFVVLISSFLFIGTLTGTLPSKHGNSNSSVTSSDGNLDINNTQAISDYLQGKWSWEVYTSSSNSTNRYRFEIQGNKIKIWYAIGNVDDNFNMSDAPVEHQFTIGEVTRDVDGYKARYLLFDESNVSLAYRAISPIWFVDDKHWDTPVIRSGSGIPSWSRGWK